MRTARWVWVMFLLVVLTQRLAVPGLPVALLLPIALGWIVLAIRSAVVEVDMRRLVMWCAAVAVTGCALLAQTAWLASPIISITSWMLFIAVWLPCVVRLKDRRTSTYQLALRNVVRACVVLAIGCLVMMGTQLAGMPYRDVVGDVIPDSLELQGFIITAPVVYGSELYRANAWIGLEPSIVSFQLGIGLLLAILLGSSWRIVIVLVGALFATASGSGFLIAMVGMLALLASPARRLLVRQLIPAGAAAGVLAFTPFGQQLFTRSNEFFSRGSSGSIRSIEPYLQLWPVWTSDATIALLGRGAGSSQELVDNTAIGGLLVPTPAKIFFDYGWIAGLVLATLLLFCYFEGPSTTLAVTLFASLWAIQPGAVQPVFVLAVVLLVTIWAPRAGHQVERIGSQRPRTDPYRGWIRPGETRARESLAAT